ncbi:cholinesterase-like [Betta splendens]|uniref:Carboxylic ester hydrolase n=1 Tax=Betta splendens TaxID=158456 RepID=A0A6P7P7F2_BETSP|nr:cholinesterase-like [Betta splendens]
MEIISLCTQFPLLLLLLGFWTVSAATPDNLVIDTKNGKVQGKLLPVPGGNVRAFLGIPYGKPPLGKSRFRPPEPAEKWQGVRDATRFPNSCYQMPDMSIPGFKGIEMWNPNTPVSEDCLYLNVWTPNVNATQPSPPVAVLVWIYGGGFYVGTSSLDTYDGRFLSKSENVVVVSMNYRLGPLGFLSLPDNKNIPGNAGLLDQRLALQWVANNIGAFGGDPSKVTLFGESAGSLSVGLHLLSPGSQHLFHRAVMQSGSPNAFWGTVSPSEAWDRSLKLAKALDCSTSDPAALEACLQKADAEKITLKQHNVLTERHDILSLPFLPVVDGDVLPDNPEVLLSTGSLPKKELVIGLNKDEGPYFLINVVPGFSISGQSLITRNQFLHGVNLTMPDAAEVTKEAAIFHYTDPADENNSMKNRDLLCSLIGDQIFVAPVLEFAQRYSQRGGKTFLYLFDHRSSINPWPEWMGVLHGYEIEFVFGMPLNASLGYSKSEVNMTKKIMKHWANFARTGNPGGDGVNWPAFTAERQEYITLNCNPPEQKRMLRAKECELWNKLLPDIQRTADQLQACVTGNGIVPSCSYTFILILLATSFLFY